MKQIKDFPNYACSINGEVYNIITGRLLKERIISSGYKSVLLTNGNIKKEFLIHRLIALLYLPIRMKKIFVNHKDGNKLNNNINNLEWCTQKENIQHAYNSNNWNKNGQRKRKVVNIENRIIYNSIKSAAIHNNLKYSSLYSILSKNKNYYLKLI